MTTADGDVWKSKYFELKKEYDEFVESSADLEKSLEEELSEMEREKTDLKKQLASLSQMVVEQSTKLQDLEDRLVGKNAAVVELEQEREELEQRTRRQQAEIDDQARINETTLERKLLLDHYLERYQDAFIRMKTLIREQRQHIQGVSEDR